MTDKTFLAEMLDTTNSAFRYMIGTTAPYFFAAGSLWSGDFRTSYVVSSVLEEDILTVVTRNSTYAFKVLSNPQNVKLIKLPASAIEANETKIKSIGL